MTVRRAKAYLNRSQWGCGPPLKWQFACDGCGARKPNQTKGAGYRRPWDGPPPGWRRMRAGAHQVDLCGSCVAIGVWIDSPDALAAEAWGEGRRSA